MITAKSFVELYEAEKAGLPGADLPWLVSLRDKASRRLLDLGLPSARQENWRYTPALTNRLGNLSLAEPAAAPARAPLLDGALQVRLIDGLPVDTLPAAEGLSLRRLASLLQDAPEEARSLLEAASDSALAALNLALMQDGLVIAVAPGTAPAALELDQSGSAGLANPCLAVSLGEAANLTLIERVGTSAGLSNQVARFALAAGASLTHVVLLEEGAEATQLSELSVSLGRDARYNGFVFYAGAGLARRAVEITLAERGAEARLNGAYLLEGEAHGDLTSHIRHAAPDTTSKETVKGALGGKARQVFRGLITVEEGAARSDGRMANKTLLLSDKAEIDSKPELMIFHDEVQCAHGATSGKLDEQALFYLRSRGLPLPQARKLLLRSFLDETMEGLGETPLTALVTDKLDRRLQEIAR